MPVINLSRSSAYMAERRPKCPSGACGVASAVSLLSFTFYLHLAVLLLEMAASLKDPA